MCEIVCAKERGGHVVLDSGSRGGRAGSTLSCSQYFIDPFRIFNKSGLQALSVVGGCIYRIQCEHIQLEALNKA